ncbi:hypothetical protein B0H12DRAFT_1086720 [Mycena haematopus]|nr:hypothetical protein B0H12DRAFT_1086720 [Mycena haematopus]
MSLHEFEPRAGLRETMVLHFSHDSSHSLSERTALGYIVVPKPDRLPLAAKSHNVESRPIPRSINKPAKLSSRAPQDICMAVSPPRPCISGKDAIESELPLAVSLSRPCTPFQPLPPVIATSPLRLSSFLDDIILHSLHNEPPAHCVPPSFESGSPSPQPLFQQLSLEIPSLSHPNSPYVPWPSPVRRNILRPLTPSSQVSHFSGYSRPYSRSGARAPEPQEPNSPPHNHTKFLRLSRSFKNLGRAVKRSVRHVKNTLRKTSKSPEAVAEVVDPQTRCPSSFPPPLPSPVASCESSHTNTLAEWLQECEAKVERATPHFMTLEEYEERGSWMDLTTIHDESEVHSPPMSDDVSELFSAMSPTCTPMSPACPGSLFPHLSLHDIWPTPPRYIPQARGCSDK